MASTIDIDIRPLKNFARKLPPCALRTVLLAEDDFIDLTRFFALIPLWLRLAKEGVRNGRYA
ncbi:MAG: hypothetical protein QXS05_04005 [Candidatus Bathyarchaeia archaeon]